MKRAELIARLLELADYVEPREWDLPLDLADVLREAAKALEVTLPKPEPPAVPRRKETDKMIDINGIKTRIKAARRARSLTQEQLGARLGIVGVGIQQWECGNRTPKLSSINALATALDVSVSYLLGLEPPEEVGP